MNGYPLDTWLAALASRLRWVTWATPPPLRVEVDLDDVTALAALRSATNAVGLPPFVSVGPLLVVPPGTVAVGLPSRAPTVTTVVLPDGRTLALEVQATLVPRDPDDHDAVANVAIDGITYGVGDALYDEATEAELPLRVEAIEHDRVSLRVDGAPAPVFVPFP